MKFRRRGPSVVLLAAIVPLGFHAWRSGRERAGLEAEYARLALEVGDLDVADASKVHLKAIPTGDPRHFAWRCYVPPGTVRHRQETGPAASGGIEDSRISDNRPADGFFKILFREQEDGDGLDVKIFQEHRQSYRSFGDRSLAEFLRGRWDRVVVEQAAVAGPVALGPGEPLMLLRLALPPDLAAEGRDKLSDAAKAFLPDLFRYTINPPEAGP